MAVHSSDINNNNSVLDAIRRDILFCLFFPRWKFAFSATGHRRSSEMEIAKRYLGPPGSAIPVSIYGNILT